MEESISWTQPALNEPKDFNDMTVVEQMQCIGQLIAVICYEKQKQTGGTSMTYKVNGISLKKDNTPCGNVTITWEAPCVE